jgi:hypothetical protein
VGIYSVPKNGCASSKVATAGGAIGGRAGTGGHFQFGSDVVFQLDWRLGANPILNGTNYTPASESVNAFL